MDRRRFLQAAGASSLALGQAANTLSAQERRPPNVLLILGDNQQWGTIASRTVCRTPNINRLASQGMLFNRSYTTAAVCSPARNALLTGAFNWEFGTYNQPDTPPAISKDMFPDVVTYAQRLRAAGYQLGYSGKWHTSTERSPLDFGYHEIGAPHRYRGRLRELEERLGQKSPDRELRKPTKMISWAGTEPFGLWGYTDCEEEETAWHRAADAGIGMIERFTQQGKPWCVEVHFAEDARAWPLEKYRRRYHAASIPVDRNFYDKFEGKPGLHRRDAETYGDMSAQDFQEGRAFYYASFEQLDFQVGRLLDSLDESGQADNTIVVFTADHGAAWGAHHMWIPCFAPYEELYRIPMVIRWPGHIREGSVCNHLVQLHDLAHTFVDVAGVPPLPHAHGDSLVPLFEDPARSDWKDMILCPWYGQNFPMIYRMVITERYKYVFNAYDYDECYDLQEDSAELLNIVADSRHAAIVADMQARTYELMNRFRDPVGETGGGLPNQERFLAQRYLPQGKRLPN